MLFVEAATLGNSLEDERAQGSTSFAEYANFHDNAISSNREFSNADLPNLQTDATFISNGFQL